VGDVARAPGPLGSAHRLSAPVITRQSVQTAAHPAFAERGHAEADRVDASADSPVPSGSERTAPAQSSSGAPRSRGPVAKVGGARSRAAPRLCRRDTHVPPDPSPGTISPGSTEPDPVKPATGIRDALSRCAPT